MKIDSAKVIDAGGVPVSGAYMEVKSRGSGRMLNKKVGPTDNQGIVALFDRVAIDRYSYVAVTTEDGREYVVDRFSFEGRSMVIIKISYAFGPDQIEDIIPRSNLK